MLRRKESHLAEVSFLSEANTKIFSEVELFMKFSWKCNSANQHKNNNNNVKNKETELISETKELGIKKHSIDLALRVRAIF